MHPVASASTGPTCLPDPADDAMDTTQYNIQSQGVGQVDPPDATINVPLEQPIAGHPPGVSAPF